MPTCNDKGQYYCNKSQNIFRLMCKYLATISLCKQQLKQ